jgi:two-component system KDP operon response regulator KdpE
MKILIIEDDSEITEFISLALEIGWQGVKIISTHQGTEGIQLVESESPDAVILDIGLSDISGFDVLKQIRAFSSVPVFIETINKSEADIVKGLGLGADEYITKPFGQIELLAKMQAILRRHGTDDSRNLIYGSLYLDASRGQISCGPKKVSLTRTETLIMQALINHAPQVTTFSDLAETIWGDECSYVEATLRTYIRRIRKKLETVSEKTIIIRSMPGVGYILENLG